ncbi:TonB family protein [Roseovarius sp. D22-M7]|uniref:TonB family protein n=1 Tax=Roseovarius sp. D22-M7 TaxID=3127116 RepID=UPI0030101631
MIRASRSMIMVCAGAALALHGAGLWVSDPRATIEIDGGAGASEAMLGSSFADMVAGAVQPVSDSTVTPNRQVVEILEPTEPAEIARPTASAPGVAPPETAPAAEDAVPLLAARDPDLSAPLASEKYSIPMVSAADPLRPTSPASPRDSTPSPVIAATSPVESAEAPAKDVVGAEPGPQQGVQVSRRPQARPREVEQAATARQSPARQEARSRSRQGNNATRNAKAGSAAGRESATATRQGRDTTRRSEAQGNAAASNYPGLVMRHLARVPRPRATSRGAAIVRFSIGTGGRLASVGLARSSGSSRLDRAALTVVRRAAPFPDPPSGAQRSFSVKIEGR